MRLLDAEVRRGILEETVKVEITLAELMVIQSMTYRFDGTRLEAGLREDYSLGPEIKEPWRVRDMLNDTADTILSLRGVEGQ